MLVIGLDGVCSTVLDPLIERGVVPELEQLSTQSARGPLESQLPPWTPSAWPSMYTGVNPGKHGVYGFLHFDGYDWDVVNRSHVKEFAIWELLSEQGFNSVVLNVPATHPPHPFDGVLVPGYMAPESPECHPGGIWDELEREFDYTLYNDTLRSGPARQAEELAELARLRGEAFRYLIEEQDPDFGFLQFQVTDTIYHQRPDDESAISRVYATVDREVGATLDACDPDVVLVVSDHGLGPIEGYEFRVNDYLRGLEYATAVATGGGMPSWKSEVRRDSATDRWSGRLESAAATALEGAARVGVTSQRIGALLRYLGLEDRVLESVPVDLVRAGTEQVDFPNSTAYLRVRTEMGVRLNLEGREPDGVVSPSDYERVRTELIEVLEDVETPAGDPVFETVSPREAVFDGPHLENAPDIVTVPNRFDHFLVATLKGANFGDPTEPWEHKRDGILMAAGDGIDPELSLDGAHLFDVAPTIIATFGLPIPERMDGTPLPTVDSTERTTYPAFERSDSVVTDDSIVEDRLADLGYLE